MEVGTAFAAEYVSPQYPDHYNRAFAFSILLYPQPQQIALRRSCLSPKRARHNYGLTEFRADDTKGLGAVCSPVVHW